MAASLAIITLVGLGAAYFFTRLKLPGLVGMLFVGIFLGPHLLNLISPELMNVSSDFRNIALIVILLRAGLELHRETLNRVGRPALIMSALPAVFEIAGIVWIAPKLLPMTYMEAAILGSILAAVSPAVVVPLMIDFMDEGRGVKKGIPTLILSASALDDVFVIVLFTSFLGMYGGGEVNLFLRLAEIPMSIVLGILAGIIPGFVLLRIFMKYDLRPPKRTLLVMGVAILLTWTEHKCKPWVPMASLLGVMAMGFIILEKSEPIAHIISQKLKKLWVFAELLLFVLVGAQVDIHVAWEAGAAGVLVILVGLVFRSVGTYLSLLRTPLNFRERLFCVVAYIPKATVQAAIGALPLTAGVASGEIILAIAVLSILITAPAGAIGIVVFGRKVLDVDPQSEYRFRDLREKQGLPQVGERIRNKESGTLWKVIEEKEFWLAICSTEEDKGQLPDEPGSIPAISQRYWREKPEKGTGRGTTMICRYSHKDPSFQNQWEILYDW